MPRFLIILLSFGCSDYEVSRIEEAEKKSWFEETSDGYQSGFNPHADTEGEEEEVPAEEIEDDTGMWDVPDEDDEHQPSPDPEDDDSSEDEDTPSQARMTLPTRTPRLIPTRDLAQVHHQAVRLRHLCRPLGPL